MTTRSSVFIATSLDGFIARPDGSIDWLEEANKTIPEGEDCGYGAFIADIDTLVMGRASFDKVLEFGQWHYGDLPVIVLTRRTLDLAEGFEGNVTASAETPEALVERLGDMGRKHLYIDGGVTIRRFLDAGLIDDMTITTIPVAIGEGRPLFGPLGRDIGFAPVSTRAFEFGFVQTVWKVTS